MSVTFITPLPLFMNEEMEQRKRKLQKFSQVCLGMTKVSPHSCLLDPPIFLGPLVEFSQTSLQ